jgi:competence protein ComEC
MFLRRCARWFLLAASGVRLWAGAADGTLDLYWIDSLGGGSTLLVTPADESVLFDSGNPGGRDAGHIVRVAAEVAGLKRLDHLVTTHLHIDHFGGAAEIAARLPVGHVHDNGVPDRDPDGNNDPTWPQKIRAYREFPAGARSVVTPGEQVALRQATAAEAPRLSLTFVAAKQRFAVKRDGIANVADCGDPNPRPADTSDNANSVVTLVQFGGFRLFHGGDLTWNVEAQLVCPVAQTGPVDVYQVNHHGLDVSNNPLLLRHLAPTVAVFNNGPRKGCAPAVVTALRGLPQPPVTFQVHRNQTAPAANAPAPHLANEGLPGGEHLKLSVAADAKTYTVTVPRTGHRQTFAVKGAAN